MSSNKSGSSLKFFPGQKDFAGGLFEPGGLFASLLSGAPDVGFERGAARGADALTGQLAGQGLTGTGLAAKAMTNYQGDVQGQRQDNVLRILQQAIQPAGSVSVSRSKPFGLF